MESVAGILLVARATIVIRITINNSIIENDNNTDLNKDVNAINSDIITVTYTSILN